MYRDYHYEVDNRCEEAKAFVCKCREVEEDHKHCQPSYNWYKKCTCKSCKHRCGCKRCTHKRNKKFKCYCEEVN